MAFSNVPELASGEARNWSPRQLEWTQREILRCTRHLWLVTLLEYVSQYGAADPWHLDVAYYVFDGSVVVRATESASKPLSPSSTLNLLAAKQSRQNVRT